MDRLRKRRDFLAAARAERAGVAAFLMQGRDRGDAGAMRIGLTVTKKTGNAVIRNRIRRRLREAVRRVLPQAGRPGYDYVLVARDTALHMPFDGLVQDLERAVRKLHAPAPPRSAKRAPGPQARGQQTQDHKTQDHQALDALDHQTQDLQAPDHQAHSPDPKAKPADGGHPA